MKVKVMPQYACLLVQHHAVKVIQSRLNSTAEEIRVKMSWYLLAVP